MKINKYHLLIASFVFISFIPVLLCASEPYIFGVDDYSIYSALLNKWYAENKETTIVIRGRTTMHREPKLWEDELSYVKEKMSSLAQETINDFKAKNTKSYPLGTFINQKGNYVILDDQEKNWLFEPKSRWEKFYEKYPASQGLLTFSRVGFNPARNQAFVYVANQWERFAGSGLYVLLEKTKDQTWIIADELRIWNSWHIDEIKP
jgi:hypothetical protein